MSIKKTVIVLILSTIALNSNVFSSDNKSNVSLSVTELNRIQEMFLSPDEKINIYAAKQVIALTNTNTKKEEILTQLLTDYDKRAENFDFISYPKILLEYIVGHFFERMKNLDYKYKLPPIYGLFKETAFEYELEKINELLTSKNKNAQNLGLIFAYINTSLLLEFDIVRQEKNDIKPLITNVSKLILSRIENDTPENLKYWIYYSFNYSLKLQDWDLSYFVISLLLSREKTANFNKAFYDYLNNFLFKIIKGSSMVEKNPFPSDLFSNLNFFTYVRLNNIDSISIRIKEDLLINRLYEGPKSIQDSNIRSILREVTVDTSYEKSKFIRDVIYKGMPLEDINFLKINSNISKDIYSILENLPTPNHNSRTQRFSCQSEIDKFF